jgi:hypothetical protein
MVTILNLLQQQAGFVKGLELVKKRSLWGYKGDDVVMFLKIVVTEPSKLPRVRDESSYTPCHEIQILTYHYYASSREESAHGTACLRDKYLRSRAILRTSFDS